MDHLIPFSQLDSLRQDRISFFGLFCVWSLYYYYYFNLRFSSAQMTLLVYSSPLCPNVIIPLLFLSIPKMFFFFSFSVPIFFCFHQQLIQVSSQLSLPSPFLIFIDICSISNLPYLSLLSPVFYYTSSNLTLIVFPLSFFVLVLLSLKSPFLL